MLVSVDNSGKGTLATWTTLIRAFLCLHDFSHLWLYQGMGDAGRFISNREEEEKKKCLWKAGKRIFVLVTDMMCKSFKSVIMTGTYLGVLEQKHVRDAYCRFWFGIPVLLCHKNRYNEYNSFRPVCKTESKNKIHFLLVYGICKHQTIHSS